MKCQGLKVFQPRVMIDQTGRVQGKLEQEVHCCVSLSDYADD